MLATGVSVPRNPQAHNRELFPAYTVEFGWRYAYQRCRSLAICLEAAYNFADNFEFQQSREQKPFPMFAGVSIKANILHADFIEWSYGVDLW